MKHGQDNEINAVATLVAKILPSLKPALAFYEQGCHVDHNGHIFMVVSPDGCCKSSDQTSKLGIEIKFPKPGKQFTTDVHYKIPA